MQEDFSEAVFEQTGRTESTEEGVSLEEGVCEVISQDLPSREFCKGE